MDVLKFCFFLSTLIVSTIYCDLPPKFSRRTIVLNLREEQPIGTHLMKSNAYDPDGDELEYSIIGRHKRYVNIDKKSGNVTTAQVIDRERVVLFVFKVIARQVNDTKKRCVQKVYVHIIDMNDNPPVFMKQLYNVSVSEDTGSGVYILKVEAHDKDGDDLTFSITKGNNLNYFQIEEKTGVLRTVKQLDYETKPQFKLIVTAKDGLTNQHAVTTRVHIGIINEDDIGQAGILKQVAHSSPDITIVNVKEEQRVGTYLLTASPTNFVGGSVEFTLSGKHKDYFWIDHRSGYMTTTKMIDYEKIKYLKFEIIASRVFSKRQVSVQSVLVRVVDVNDHAPSFSHYVYTTEISEKAKIDTSVLQVNATDKDDDTLIYTIVRGNKDGFFTLDLYTGKIKVAKELDYESKAKFCLQVSVTDVNKKGINSHTAVAEVNINILDEKEENEEKEKKLLVPNHVPQFDRGVIVMNLREELPAGKYLFYAKAHDRDGDAIEYSLAGKDASYVWIDYRSGYLTTTKSVDREQVKKLTFKIIASEVNNPAHRSEQSVIIHIIDVNDNRPNFKQQRYGVKVSENTGAGVFIVKVSATDGDGDILRYSITEGNANGFFVIDRLSGAIRTARKLDYETQARFKLKVTVTDGKPAAKRRHIVYASVYVYLIDEDERKSNIKINNIPTFSSDIKVIEFEEEQPIGKALMKALARDADGDIVQYSIYGGGREYFEIEPITGEIETIKRIDHEKLQLLRFNIIAYELDRPKVQSIQSVVVHITDINDNAPEFTEDIYDLNITESIGKGKFVTRVVANDNDTSDELMYSITNGNELGFFKIDLYTGIISTAKELDFSVQASHDLEVTVTDSGRNGNKGHSVKTNVTINVIAEGVPKRAIISRYKPEFTRGIAAVSVLEEQAIGTFVHKASAKDKDGDKIQFSLVGNSAENFHIDQETGIVSTARVIDREQVAKILLKVVAAEAKNPSQKSEQALIVNVIDVNDNAPVFKQKKYMAEVSEYLPTGTQLLRVMATDVDVDDEAELVYSITTGNEMRFFSIDTFNGVISTAKPLNYNRQSVFNLQVSVTDRAKPKKMRHAALTNVHIKVLDEIDNNDMQDGQKNEIGIQVPS